MTSTIQLSGRDYGNEITRFTAYFPTAESANYDDLVTALNSVQTSVNTVTVGDFTGKSLKGVDVPASGKAAVTDAQRERKWLVSYTDDVDVIGNGSFEIGMADSSLLASDGENMDISGGAGAAFVTVLEANLVSRLGNAITVQTIKLVGRNT